MTPAAAIPYRPGTMHEQRLTRFRHRMGEDGLDVAVLVPGPNLRYLTGLTVGPSERLFLGVVPKDGAMRLLVPELERPAVEPEVPAEVPIASHRDEAGPDRALAQLAHDVGLGSARVGVEHGRMRVRELRALERHADPASIADLDPTAMALRRIKDEAEIASLRRAIGLSEALLDAMVNAMEPGVTERDVVRAFERARIESECEAVPFGPIVASGPNTESPHAEPGERALQAGDLVTIDCGAVVDGYPGDITRNVAVGELDPERERIHQVVLEANEAGREACRPGATAASVDRAARAVIEDAGYGDYFVHRTGHGMGLEVHEPPDIMAGNDEALEPNMVFTVEPGVYVPGVGGARVEDDMLVTPNGAESLTRYPRELTRR
ncbi:MAG: M24 family metallopeptidase [Candidatus Bipolaricaulia bacterium]